MRAFLPLDLANAWVVYVIRGHYASVLSTLSGIIALKYAAANSH